MRTLFLASVLAWGDRVLTRLYPPGAGLCQKCTFGTDSPCDRSHGTDGDDGDSRDSLSADPFQSDR
jgi:hypothetical protein